MKAVVMPIGNIPLVVLYFKDLKILDGGCGTDALNLR